MQTCVDETGRVRLTPGVKRWMREHLSGPFYDTTAWEGAMVFAEEAKRLNPDVCRPCTASRLYDVLERAHRMKGRVSGT
jgi:hypothetical protein